jgi:small subunit ribosomal protein S21
MRRLEFILGSSGAPGRRISVATIVHGFVTWNKAERPQHFDVRAGRRRSDTRADADFGSRVRLDSARPICYPPLPRWRSVRATQTPPLPMFSRFSRPRLATQDRPLQVLVRDNNVDQALKALKKKMQREGIFREMKLRGHYEKPSEKRAREKAEAVRRARKLARKKLQREGLLPMKPKVVPGAPRAAS